MIQFHAQVFVMGWEKTTICLKKKVFHFLICLESLEVDFLDEQIIIWFVVSIFFDFHPTWGNDPIWLIFFKWVETTNQSLTHTHTFDVLFFSRRCFYSLHHGIWITHLEKNMFGLAFFKLHEDILTGVVFIKFSQKRNINNIYKITDWKLHIWI